MLRLCSSYLKYASQNPRILPRNHHMRANPIRMKTKNLLAFYSLAGILFAAILVLSRSPIVVYELGRINTLLLGRGRVAGLHLIRLPVVYHHQEHSLSCEVASLQMGLSAIGINVSE